MAKDTDLNLLLLDVALSGVVLFGKTTTCGVNTSWTYLIYLCSSLSVISFR